MKFLPRSLDDANLMILRTYYNSGTQDYKTPDDVLDVIYKDIDTGKIYVESIINPKIDIWIANKDHRDYTHYKNFIKKEWATKHTVSYKTRYAEIGKILGVSPRDAKYSPYVYQIDMDIEHFYMMEFFKEYGYKTETKPLTLGFFDIESDIIQQSGFASPGEAPTNAISYFDSNTNTMYTLLCIQDNVPHVPESSRNYEFYEKLRARFKRQTEDFVNRIDEFKEECKKSFEESYGKIDYKIFVFDEEIAMHKAFWKIVHFCQNDFMFAWNAPYDVSNLIERPKTLGYDPDDFIPDSSFEGRRHVKWYEDKNATVHKRKHIFDTFTLTTIMDQMVNYAGKRSGKGKLPSVKLNAIAKNELKDTKLDYSEYGNIRMFPYYDWWRFVLYNIKDVLLQVGIDRKTRDADYVYLIMNTSCLKPSEIFTSTTVVANDLRLFADMEEGSVMGSNKNKLYKVAKTEEQIKEEKKDKFAGAFVMNPAHCSSTGFILLGTLNRYIHDHAIDEDIGSEYPSGMLISNCSNETMVGKVFLVNPEEIHIKMYENMYVVDGDDQVIYNKTTDPSNLMVEGLSENNPTAFGQQFLNLPSFTEIATHIEDNMVDFI
jgi:hypothetical protein